MNQDGYNSQQSDSSEIVGWVAGINEGEKDHQIASYCSVLGKLGYNFVNYPVGGMKRCSWAPNELDALYFLIDIFELRIFMY